MKTNSPPPTLIPSRQQNQTTVKIVNYTSGLKCVAKIHIPPFLLTPIGGSFGETSPTLNYYFGRACAIYSRQSRDLADNNMAPQSSSSCIILMAIPSLS